MLHVNNNNSKITFLKSLSREQLEIYVKQSTSFKKLQEIIFNSVGSGSTHTFIVKRIKEFNIDVSHFTGQRWNKGLTKLEHDSLKKAGQTFKEGLKSGRFQPSFLGRKLSKEHREAISRGHKETSNFNGFIKTKWLKVTCNFTGEIVKVQGTWEKKYAEWLNKNNVPWIKSRDLRLSWVDSSRFKRIYYPDFYLPLTKEFIEIKGYMWKNKLSGVDDEDKLIRVQNQNSNINLRILMKKELSELGVL